MSLVSLSSSYNCIYLSSSSYIFSLKAYLSILPTCNFSFFNYNTSSFLSILHLLWFTFTFSSLCFKTSRSSSNSAIFYACTSVNVRASSASFIKIFVSSSSILILVFLSWRKVFFKIAVRSAKSFFNALLSFKTYTASTIIAIN